MNFQIIYNDRISNICGRNNVIQIIKDSENISEIKDIRKVYKTGQTTSVLESYDKYLYNSLIRQNSYCNA